MTTRIERHADIYAQSVAEFLEQPKRLRRRATEQPLLDLLTRHVEAVVDTYDPPGIRRAGDSLVFAHIYASLLESTAMAAPHVRAVNSLLAPLIAAEVEFRGPLRLSRTQNRLLAEVYERLGPPLVQAGLPAHAALSYRRAFSLYLIDEDGTAMDHCGLALARARRSAAPTIWRRMTGLFADLVFGYGYRPFRMLWFIAFQLLAFGIAIGLGSREPIAFTAFKVLVNYLNPLGLLNTANEGLAVRPLYVAESYAGAISMSVFFALLVRRWFRL